jgi:hypothetical protein
MNCRRSMGGTAYSPSSEVTKMIVDGIMSMDSGATRLRSGAWPSGKATDFESPDEAVEAMTSANLRIATGVDWAFAPDWLDLDQACFLSGWDRGAMLEIIRVDGVDLNDAGLIEKHSLWEFQETLVELAHWDD